MSFGLITSSICLAHASGVSQLFLALLELSSLIRGFNRSGLLVCHPLERVVELRSGGKENDERHLRELEGEHGEKVHRASAVLTRFE